MDYMLEGMEEEARERMRKDFDDVLDWVCTVRHGEGNGFYDAIETNKNDKDMKAGVKDNGKDSEAMRVLRERIFPLMEACVEGRLTGLFTYSGANMLLNALDIRFGRKDGYNNCWLSVEGRRFGEGGFEFRVKDLDLLTIKGGERAYRSVDEVMRGMVTHGMVLIKEDVESSGVPGVLDVEVVGRSMTLVGVKCWEEEGENRVFVCEEGGCLWRRAEDLFDDGWRYADGSVFGMEE